MVFFGRVAAFFLLITFIYGCGGGGGPGEGGNPDPDPSGPCQSSDDCYRYLAGAGKSDITGPYGPKYNPTTTHLSCGMMGYSLVEQRAVGIENGLDARAVVIQDPESQRRFAIVSAETSQLFGAVKYGVIRKLQAAFGDAYDHNNVLINATHNHSSLAGTSYYAMYNMSSQRDNVVPNMAEGFVLANYNAMVNGIVQAITNAHNSLVEVNVEHGHRDIPNTEELRIYKRSLGAYKNNTGARTLIDGNQLPDSPIDILKITEVATGNPLAMVTFFAVHNVAIGNTNTLVHDELYGRASDRLEAHYFADHPGFVALMVQGASGDLTPNNAGFRPEDILAQFERTTTIGNQLAKEAFDTWSGPTTEVSGTVNYRHTRENMAAYCEPRVGQQTLLGTPDGDGTNPIFAKIPGLIVGDINCQGIKKAALKVDDASGNGSGLNKGPSVAALQVGLIGNFGILAVPFEMTEHAGKLLVENVADYLTDANNLVVAGLSNDYLSYMTTSQEYNWQGPRWKGNDGQSYEASSTLFGATSASVVRDKMAELARLLQTGEAVVGSATDPQASVDVNALGRATCGEMKLVNGQDCTAAGILTGKPFPYGSACLSNVCDLTCTDCVSNSDCDSGEFCEVNFLAANYCKKLGSVNTGGSCSANNQCNSGHCEVIGGKCVECEANSHCESGEFCSMFPLYQCKSKKPVGQICGSIFGNAECKSNLCGAEGTCRCKTNAHCSEVGKNSCIANVCF